MESKKMPNIGSAIQNYIQGNVSAEDERILYSWLKENPEDEKILFGEKDIWEATQLGTERLNEIETSQWSLLKDKISTRKITNTKFHQALKIAAIVIFTFGVGWMGHSLYSSGIFSNTQVELKHIEATKGQIKEIFLADGTHVWLNSDSKLSFPSNFTKDTREIELEGEAYFEVTSNEETPFLVKTKNHTVKVTGTQFNICEYPESKIIETTLVEGKVKIITGNIIKDLLPGQQSSFSTLTSEVKINEPEFETYSAWKEGRYEFSNEPVGKIFQIMERWWDVDIVYPETNLKYERIAGVLRKHKPIEQHLEVFKQLVPMEYEIGTDIINVTVK